MKSALVLCGGMPQIALIKELQIRNYRVILADMNEQAPAVSFADKFYAVSTLDVDGIRRIAVEEQVDFLISVCADQMLLIVAQISEELGLPCYVDYKTSKDVSSKEYMKDIFMKGDVPTSKYIVRRTLKPEDLEDLKFPLIVKPVDAYSSKGVRKCENYEELVEGFSEAVHISRTDTAVVEEYVGGEEYSVDVYVEDGRAHVLCMGMLSKIPQKGKFVICRATYPPLVSDFVKAEIADVAQKIADAFKLKNTPMLIQLKVDGERVSVIEFCSRTGGGNKFSLIQKITGFDVITAVLDLTLGLKPHVPEFANETYIVDEFVYCNPGILNQVEGFAELLEEGIIDDYFVFKKEGSQFEEIKSSGDRLAYFSVSAKTHKELTLKHTLANRRIKAISSDGKDLIKHDYIVL